jgi:predicted MFS family arabinose efflux permease
MIALSLNASAMYLGFAFGGALGRAVLGALSPTDLGRVGGASMSAALLVHLIRGWRERPKAVKIAG